MYSEAQAADEVYKLVLDGTVYFFKFSGAALKLGLQGGVKMAALIQAIANQDNRTRGKVKMARIIGEGKGISTFLIPASELATFHKQAKSSKLLYTAVESEAVQQARKQALETGTAYIPPADEMVMIYCAGDKANVVNSLIMANKMHGRQVADAEQVGQEQASQGAIPVQEVAPGQTEQQVSEGTAVPEGEKEINQNYDDLMNLFRQQEPASTVVEAAREASGDELDPTQAGRSGNQSGTDSPRSTAAMEFKQPNVVTSQELMSEAFRESRAAAAFHSHVGSAVFVDGENRPLLRLDSPIVELQHELFDSVTNFYGYDTAGQSYPLFETLGGDRVTGSMEKVQNYLGEYGNPTLYLQEEKIMQKDIGVSQRSSAVKPDLDIEHSESAVAPPGQQERPSIREHIKEVKKELEKAEAQEGHAQMNTPAQDRSFTSILIEKAKEKNNGIGQEGVSLS